MITRPGFATICLGCHVEKHGSMFTLIPKIVLQNIADGVGRVWKLNFIEFKYKEYGPNWGWTNCYSRRTNRAVLKTAQFDNLKCV